MISFLEDNIPHTVSEVICVKCCKRWISVRPSETLLRNIECPNCGAGFVIETMQPLYEKECEKCRLFVDGKCKLNLSAEDYCEYKIRNEDWNG